MRQQCHGCTTSATLTTRMAASPKIGRPARTASARLAEAEPSDANNTRLAAGAPRDEDGTRSVIHELR
jgi:hypothetical protein